MNQRIVISLGGSLIVPNEVDVDFLKKFKKLILFNKSKRFVLICGGGKTSRRYSSAASQVTKLHSEDIDWLGIHATRLNAHLLRTIFRDQAYATVQKDPTKKVNTSKQLIIAAGWKPGCSTDYDAVLFAKNYGAKTVINLTNVDYAYDKDPRKFKDAKIIKKTNWSSFRKVIPKKWSPNLNSPFDPVASKEAEKLRLTVVIMNGKNVKNLNNFLNSKRFIGTVITP